MNETLKQKHEFLGYYLPLRTQLLDILEDSDLSYSPGGDNQNLGDLIREHGEVQAAYIKSFGDFTIDFGYRHPDPQSLSSIAAFRTWFDDLNSQLQAALEAISDDDAENRKIDRGGGFVISAAFNLDIFREALTIFCGKAYVYLKAMGKTLPEQWREWL